MKITINQAEIEEAITKHILSQITVKEGMNINIDLRATRGAEGFQADIDINDGTNTNLDVSGKVSAAKAPATAKVNDAGDAAQTGTAQAEPAPVEAAAEDVAAVEVEQARGKSLFGSKAAAE